MSVAISEHQGIVIRKDSLERCNISVDTLREILETNGWLDEDEFLISTGPHFGREASNEFIKRLEKLGLSYGNDFIDFEDTLPSWCKMYVKFSKG